jgi:acetyl-CoA carboxylase carboxyl transferase subunit beta
MNLLKLDKNLTSKIPLRFVDTKKYADRLKDVSGRKPNLKTQRTGVGKSKGKETSHLL